MWEQTEAPFFDTLERAARRGATEAEPEAAWRDLLRHIALALFDEAAPLSAVCGGAAAAHRPRPPQPALRPDGLRQDGAALFEALGQPGRETESREEEGRMIRDPTPPVLVARDATRPGRDAAGDRAALARLRRCATVAEAMQDPATIALFRRCGATGPNDLPAIGLAAAVLAHVRQDQPAQRVARQIGPDNPEKPETALLKPLRFRRLMEARPAMSD